MSAEKTIDWGFVEDIVQLAKGEGPHSETLCQRARYETSKLLEILLTKEELEALTLFRENKEVLQFVIKNKDMLKRVKRIGGVLRVP